MKIKRGDLLPSMVVRVAYADGSSDIADVVNLSTPAAITIKAKGRDPIVELAEATVSSVADGVVTVVYDWAPGDTDLPGEYQVEVQFTVGGRTMTAPSLGYLRLTISEDLD